jgi:MoaA/NifB/PqqE/SkfB family radical SAM enzyme
MIKKRNRLAPKLAMLKVGARAIASTKHPILIHMIPMRRCNLACAYCNEYDDHSPPVPTEEMFRRIDKAAELGASMVTFSGGEPLMHPDIYDLIRRIAHHGMLPELLTNAYYLNRDRIHRLNDAGLLRMQISIDNVQPDDVSKKSLKTIGRKLDYLVAHADFDVNINSVIGASISNPEDALAIGRHARKLGFTSTVGVLHDGNGQLQPLGSQQRAVYQDFCSTTPWPMSHFMAFKDNLVEGRPNQWRCRAGARYLYVCEDGLVHRCSQQRGYPGIPFLEYTQEHLDAEYATEKDCAPYCTVSCVHTIAVFDNWRHPQKPDQRESALVGAAD